MGNNDLDFLHAGDYRPLTTDVATGLPRATARLAAYRCPADLVQVARRMGGQVRLQPAAQKPAT